jgi:hypothetical protein
VRRSKASEVTPDQKLAGKVKHKNSRFDAKPRRPKVGADSCVASPKSALNLEHFISPILDLVYASAVADNTGALTGWRPSVTISRY